MSIRPVAFAAIAAAIALPLTDTADAGGIKFKPKPQVSVSPDVDIPSPRVRVKVKVKPQIKVKPKRQAVVANAPAAARAKPQQQANRSSPQDQRPRHQIARADFVAVIPTARPDIEAHARAIADAARAANAAQAAREAGEAARLGDMRAGATPEFGLAMPDLDREIPSNRDLLGAPQVERAGWTFGDDIAGAGSIGGPQNSHSRETPANPWAVTPGTIAAGMAGIAGTTTTYVEGSVLHLKVARADGTVTVTKIDSDPQAPARNGHEVATAESSVTYRTDGTEALGRRTVYEDGFIVESRRTPFSHGVVMFDETGGYRWNHRGPRTQQPYHRMWQTDPEAPTRLVNPDYTGPGGCQSMDCILKGGKPKGVTLKDLTDQSPNQVLPAAPDHATEGTMMSGTPILTQHDVLSTYIEERTTGPATNMQDLCFHSEC
ncbi:hypothetical protein [Oricola sp.]|uniref:hypothetical protein n=1 Tax=Oricola sp. TaxID=1979950 RepID=UPI003BADB522